MRPSRLFRVPPSLVACGALLASAGIGGAGDQSPEKKPSVKASRPRLEFRILVDVQNDWEAVDAAKQYFAAARTDPTRRERLQRRAAGGLPPEPIKLSGKGYTWVEIGPLELRACGLDEKPGDGSAPLAEVGKKVAEARDKGDPVPVMAGESPRLVWSRARPEAKPSAGKLPGKRFAYFVLVRDPEPGKAVTAKHLTAARLVEGPRAHPFEIAFELTKEGGDLMYELTSKNTGRSLAVVLDEAVIYAAVIMGPIRNQGMIKLPFTRDEAESMVAKLRAAMSR